MIWKIVIFALVFLNGLANIGSDDPSLSSLAIVVTLVSFPLLMLECVKFLKTSR